MGPPKTVGIAVIRETRLKEHSPRFPPIAGLYLLLAFSPHKAWSFCHEMEVVQGWQLNRVTASPASSGSVKVEWFGHATFQLTSSKNTSVLMDPHARQDLRWPDTSPHVVTMSHLHFAHANVFMAKGRPLLLYGLRPADGDWNPVHTVVRDVSIYTVPAFHDKSQGMQRGRNAIFVVRLDDLCVAHLGDLGHLLTPEQLKLMGKIDILLVPVAGGMFTIDSQEARQVVAQVKPRIAIPMHYSSDEPVEEFVEGYPRVQRLNSNTLRVSKSDLPDTTEIIILNY